MSELCKNCGVTAPHNSHCPLCGRFLREGERAERFPVPKRSRRSTAKKVLRFCFIAAGFAVIFLDAFVARLQGWSLAACASLALAWVVIFRPVFARPAFGMAVLLDAAALCLFSLSLDFIYGYTGWSIAYVMPSAAAAGITAVVFGSLIKKLRWGEVGGHVVTLSLMNVAFLVLGLAGLHQDVRLSVIVAAYSALCLFGMKYFLNKAFDEEFKKKLHM